MGEVIEARFEELVPSCLGLRLNNLKGMFIREHKRITGIPAPFKKSEDTGKGYTALDSGNSRIVRLMMSGGKTAQIYVAESDEDIMLASRFPGASDFSLFRSNYSIQDGWAECEVAAKRIATQTGIKTYRDYYTVLLAKHPYLESPAKFWDYIQTRQGNANLHSIIGRLEDLS